jgi:DNA-binding MarR family transcriptional regulator
LCGRARPLDVAADLRLPPSSVSRRLDRLQEEGWVARHKYVDEHDHRAVDVELTKTGRRLWREMSVTYRRALQALFAIHLSAEDIADMQRILDQLVVAGQEFEETPATDDT